MILARTPQHFFFLSPYTSDTNLQCAITAQASNYTQVIEAPEFPQNTWTHVAVTLDGRQGILYLNGQAVAVNNSVNLLPSDLGANEKLFRQKPVPGGSLFQRRIGFGENQFADVVAGANFRADLVHHATGFGHALFRRQCLAYAGVATDYSDALLSPSAYSWSGEFHHDGLTDPFFGPLSGATEWHGFDSHKRPDFHQCFLPVLSDRHRHERKSTVRFRGCAAASWHAQFGHRAGGFAGELGRPEPERANFAW